MNILELKSIEIVCEECRISRHDLLKFVVKESEELEVGEAAIPIILNLLDQLHVLRKMMKT